MTVQSGRFVPLFPSEQLLRGFDGQPPFKGCGLSTILVDAAWGTLGECQIRPNGRPFDKGDFTNQLKTGWRAFEKVFDKNGIPDRDDVVRIHKAMLPGLPTPQPLVSRDFDEVVEALKEDQAISIAVFLAALPDGAVLKRFAGNAPHQIPLVGIRNGKSRCQDGMHVPQPGWPGHDVPLSQVEKAAKSFPDARGLVMAWKVPIGGWTQAALATDGLRDKLRDERDRVSVLSAKVDGQAERIERLRADLAACEAGQGTDCSDAEKEARRKALAEAVVAVEGLAS